MPYARESISHTHRFALLLLSTTHGHGLWCGGNENSTGSRVMVSVDKSKVELTTIDVAGHHGPYILVVLYVEHA
jgi:hypothetical protein